MLIKLFSSEAKIKIFKLLSRSSQPLCFREIVDFAEVAIRSAQIALKEFEKINIVKIKKYRNQKLYVLRELPQLKKYRDLVLAEELEGVAEQAPEYSVSAKRTINSMDSFQQLNKIIKHAKEKRLREK